MKGLDSTPFEAVRVGIVSSIDRKKGTARVYFGDREEAVSYELKVISLQTMKNKHYWMPDIDETVICLFLANGQETGYVIGSIYSDVDIPPTDKKEKGIWFEDGTIIKYNLESKTIFIDSVGEINIKAKNPIKIVAENGVSIEGSLNVTGDVVANGISLVNHIHSYPTGTTSAPLKG